MPANTPQYQRDYRKRNPAYLKRVKALEKARREARIALAERYPQEYQRILNEIKQREQL